MPRPRLIPEDLYPEILERSAKRQSTDSIAEWVSGKIGKSVNGRTVRLMLSQIRKERAPIAQAVVTERLSKTLNADLDAVDKLLAGAQKYEQDAGKLKKLLDEAEKIAFADISKTVGQGGAFLPLAEMPDDVRGAVAGIEVFEEFEGEGAERVKIGETVKLKLWEKTKAIELAARIRSGHMAMEAMKMQKALLELRFRLSGAGGAGAGESGVVVLPPEGD